MYQGTIYQYNQRAEILIPERRGTSYFGPDNHKPLICYKGLNIDIDFFAKDTRAALTTDKSLPILSTRSTFMVCILNTSSLQRPLQLFLPTHDYSSNTDEFL